MILSYVMHRKAGIDTWCSVVVASATMQAVALPVVSVQWPAVSAFGLHRRRLAFQCFGAAMRTVHSGCSAMELQQADSTAVSSTICTKHTGQSFLVGRLLDKPPKAPLS